MDEIFAAKRKEKVISEKGGWDNIVFCKPKPSADCPDGYKSRVGIHEVLEVTETIKQMTVNRATSDQIEEQAKKEGMITMLQAGFIKAAQGLTAIEEILRVTKE